MKEQKPQYPASLFWTGVALNILRSFLWLVIATVLMLLGTGTPWLGWAGVTLLVLVVVIALIRQMVYRHTVLHSTTPEFADWQAAMLSPDWEANVKDMVERALHDDPGAELTDEELTTEEDEDREDLMDSTDRTDGDDPRNGGEN